MGNKFDHIVKIVVLIFIWPIYGYTQGLGVTKVNLNSAAENAALTIKGALVVGSRFDNEGNPREHALEIAQDGRIKEYLVWVEKGIVTRRFKIDTISHWADYVFEEDYSLLTLKKTKKYIKAHGHLPDIPSAQKLATEGYDVTNMTRNMVIKIEELSLHILDHEKKIKTLQKSLASFEKVEQKISQLKNLLHQKNNRTSESKTDLELTSESQFSEASDDQTDPCQINSSITTAGDGKNVLLYEWC